jgi:hypothetical protein
MSKIDLTGRRFERLVVLGRAGVSHTGKRQWLCQCDCGKQHVTNTGALNANATRSCGCLHDELATQRVRMFAPKPKPTGMSALKHVYNQTRNNAQKVRGLEFMLTFGQFLDLVRCDCAYCGGPPSNTARYKGCNGVPRYTGIDRVDNTRGYHLDNCIPCCETCNKAKRTLSLREFAQWVTRLARHHPTWTERALAFHPAPASGRATMSSASSDCLPSAGPIASSRA